ncbi:hypothetical protein EA748_08080 [Acinetobacter ursingii]|uniref:hypothetical protein n=1 Tax=Acinetobacter ursingii TaxID=108980 RepID=UPI000F768CAE|nr:hypothetical protein [Acinetobacter ursingii]RSO82899.1 hypothetical protein EA748_08080 [Acinetobacter ursingii]
MSNKIVNEIRRLPIDSTPKMLLWVISDIADDEGNTTWYAPRSRLMEETGYGKTTIASCISYLKECGLIRVIGGNGRQNQYIVTPESFNSTVKYEPKKDTKPVREVNQSTTQTSSLGEPHQSATRTTPVHLAEKPVREVNTIPHSIINPSVNPSIGDSEDAPKAKAEPKVKRITKKQAGINRLVELGCDEKYAHDWMVNRKGAPLTDSVLENLIEQANKANITLATAVQWTAKKGYQGFKADWYLKDQQPQQNWNNGYQSSAQQTANEQAKWDEFLNGGSHYVDVTPKKSILIEGVGHA